MFRRFSWFWAVVARITDILIIILLWVFTQASTEQGFALWTTGNISSFVLLTFGWIVITRLFSVYDSMRLMSFKEEIKVLSLVVIIFGFLVDLLSTVLFVGDRYGVTYTLLLWCAIVGLHVFLKLVLQFMRRRGFNLQKVVIYGAGPSGVRTASNLIGQPQAGIRILGFLDDDPSLWASQLPCNGTMIPVIGSSNEVGKIVKERDVHEVITALPSSEYQRLKEFLAETASLPINVHIVPDLHDFMSVAAQSEVVWDVPIIAVRQPSIGGFDAAAKRTLDLLLTCLSLLFILPLMLIIAILIKLDSRGPVFFTQERAGLNGKLFKIYKFRTMVTDAEKQLDSLINLEKLDQPMFKISDDPRVTRIGRILRKTSLDELPQLINVLRGEMSLVGPRPEEERIVRMYSYEQRQRLAVKPGLTGPMQVNGRGNLGFEERLTLELNYIKNYSLYRDIELLLQTVPAVLLGKGAY